MDEEIRTKILTILDQHRIMTIATLRLDGWPQATTVGYANEGLTLYFLCLRDSQKAANLARDDRVSLTIDHDTPDAMATTGLSMAARAQAVADRDEAGKALRMLQMKFSWALRAIADAIPGKHQDLPRDAYGHIRARLLEGLWTHGSRHLLGAFLSMSVGARIQSARNRAHTGIDTGHHRLSIGTITVAPPNDRCRPAPSVPLVRQTAAIGASRSFPCVPLKVA